MKTNKTISMLIKGILVLLLVLAVPVLANAQQNDEGWNYSVGTFIWASYLDTKIETPDVSVSGKKDFSDLLENATPSINLTLAAQKDKLSLHMNLFNLHLKNDIPTIIGTAERSTSMDLYIPEAFAGYEILNAELTDSVNFRLSPHVGVRYISNRIIIDRVGGGEWRDVKSSFTDPIFGAIGTFDLGETFSVTLRGDAGGFGWGSSSDTDVFGLGTVNWRYASNRTIRLGYAYLQLEADNVGRASDADVTIKAGGPIFSHTFQF